MAKYYCYQIYPKAKTNSGLQEIPITLLTTLLFHTTENKTHLYREMPLCFSCGTKGKKAVFNARLTFSQSQSESARFSRDVYVQYCVAHCGKLTRSKIMSDAILKTKVNSLIYLC